MGALHKLRIEYVIPGRPVGVSKGIPTGQATSCGHANNTLSFSNTFTVWPKCG